MDVAWVPQAGATSLDPRLRGDDEGWGVYAAPLIA